MFRFFTIHNFCSTIEVLRPADQSSYSEASVTNPWLFPWPFCVQFVFEWSHRLKW